MTAKKSINYVSIDVSAKELVVALGKKGSSAPRMASFDNSTTGHKKLLKFITKNQTASKVCLEATGIYHVELAILLAKHPLVEVMVANPKAIKHFAIASMQRAKNDPLDAKTILSYLNCMPFQAWEVPAESSLQLQAINRRMHQLKTEIQRERCHRHVSEYSQVQTGVISNDIDVNLRHLNKRVELLEAKALEIINANDELREQYHLLLSIKGVATTSAIQILSELIGLPSDMKAPQWVAYAGLDPRAVESGSSIKKARRISKAGNKYLRTALYMPAWVAVQREPLVKAFYDGLISSGKKPLQAIVSVMRKLLHAIWGMFYSKTNWEPMKFNRKAAAELTA